MGAPSACPPFSSTAAPPQAWLRRCSHSFFSSSFPSLLSPEKVSVNPVTSIPAVRSRVSASGRLGVTSVESGSNSFCKTGTAAASSSGMPEVESITGSTTTYSGLYSRSNFVTACTTAALPSIPVLTATGIKSSITAAAWRYTNPPSIATLSLTPSELCTVTAVTAACP